MAEKKTNKVKYSEPADYFPKEIMDKYFSDNKKKTATKKKSVKGTKKKK